ncbi:MAG: DUF488 domain-containing protein [Phycisphaerae bacterium]|nr:DUF488 domain-containing protein [Phycisphaerae bacterium]
MNELFTIGHSNHSLERFLKLLRSQTISTVIDVRSSPYSKYSPQFGKDILEKALPNAAIRYVFLGREIGARRSEANCYVGGQARYDRIAQLPVFQEGLAQVLEQAAKNRCAVMCSEGDPLTCHRTILICRELKKMQPGLQITHILSDAATETHDAAQQRLVKMHKLQRELFGELTTEAALINRAFDLQAEKLACAQETEEA